MDKTPRHKDVYRRKRLLGSIPFWSVAFSMTLALFLLGTFSLFMLLTRNLTEEIRSQLELQVFLDRDAQLTEVLKVQKIISGMDFVAKENNVAQIRHIPKEEAARSFMKEMGEDFTKYIGGNPLSDVLLVQVHPSYHSKESFRHMAERIERLYDVSEVTYVEKLLDSINANVRYIGMVLAGLLLILFVAVVVIVHNVIRLALYSQRFLIRSMQLVGATRRFVKRPFVLRMLLYGLFSGILSCVAIHILSTWTASHIESLVLLQRAEQMYLLYASVILAGMLASYISTQIAMNKYLSMSLDELY